MKNYPRTTFFTVAFVGNADNLNVANLGIGKVEFLNFSWVKVFTATNDGSAGVKGFVVAPLDEEIVKLRQAGRGFELFTCGPDGQLKAVSDRALSLGVPGWISVDRHMICGVGACFACIQKTVRGNSRCCIVGPVFRAEDLVW